MFSLRQKREIAEAVQHILRATNHTELPTGEIQFALHVEGAENWSWADIRNNGAVRLPDVNPHNEAQDKPGMSYQLGIFDRGSESWRFHRHDWSDHRIVGFETLDAAVTEARRLSQRLSNVNTEIVVLTLHACFKTETEYPKVEPVHRTKEIKFDFAPPEIRQEPT